MYLNGYWKDNKDSYILLLLKPIISQRRFKLFKEPNIYCKFKVFINFVANMENVLDVYKRPYSYEYPVICMDESPKQLIGETRITNRIKDGCKLIDYEYSRKGVCNIFMANEPLAGKRIVKITQQKTKQDWAEFIKDISDKYPEAQKTILVMDNLNTHKPSSLYEKYTPEIAKKIWDRFEFAFTPKHGSWLNMAKIELNVLNVQCLNTH